MRLCFKIIIFAIVVSLSLLLYAQEDDKDRINEDMNSVGAAYQAAQRSAWSLSGNPNNLTKPVNNGNGRTTVNVNERVRVGGLSFSAEQSKSPAKRGKTISEKNQESHRRSTNEAVKGMKRLAQWKAVARQKEAEEKRRRQEENRRDIQTGYDMHKATTASFYQNKAAEDAWLHTEGVRVLEEINAADRADVPVDEQKPSIEAKSGGQLANLLQQGNSQHIQVVVLDSKNEERKTGVALSAQDGRFSIFDEGRTYDIDEWSIEAAIGEFQPSSMPKKNCGEVKEAVLYDGGEYVLDSFEFSTLPYSGMVSFYGDSAYFFDGVCSDVDAMWVPNGVSQIVVCGNRIFGKANNTIVEILGKRTRTVCTFETMQFDILSDTDSSLLVHSQVWELSVVLRVDVRNYIVDELLRTYYNVRKVVSNGNCVLALVDDNIMQIDGEMSVVYSVGETVNDICICMDGLLVAYDRNVVLVKNRSSSCVFNTEGAVRLWCDMNDVYALNMGNKLVKYYQK